jgi:hypothetical protein
MKGKNHGRLLAIIFTILGVYRLWENLQWGGVSLWLTRYIYISGTLENLRQRSIPYQAFGDGPPRCHLHFVKKPGHLLTNMNSDHISTKVKHLTVDLDDRQITLDLRSIT